MTNLLVVESPSKAKTINKYLGSKYKVLASMGHIRALPKKDGSVDVNNDFKIKYEIPAKSHKAVNDLVAAMKSCDKLLLAPDPDREGEAIAWHVLEVLKQKKALKPDTPVERVVFNAITKSTVEEAIKNPRQIDMDLVNAQQARVALDYLVGFTLSPVLWKKLPGSKSAGRVQSVALRLICEREEEIEKFKNQEYWTIDADLTTDKKEKILASLTHIDGKKLDKFAIPNQDEANKIKEILEKKEYKVSSIERKQTKKNPYAPFTTSTLQQEASKKLGFSAKQTMMIAQKLYEGKDVGNGTHGLITYMRTDGVYTAPEAISKARDYIKKEYGDKYLPQKAIIYQNKVKNAQEAHEAIRPTDPSCSPNSIKKYLTDEEYKLYDLIWKRLIASQMESVIFDQVAINIETESKYGILRATGSVIKFDGFYILYNINKEEDEEKTDEDSEKILPNVNEGQKLNLKEIKALQHFTEPPARYSEASLVKKMEELGIGRPSTYATILSVIQEREYVKLEKKKFIPEERGRIVIAFLKKYFLKYIEYDYTAKLEDDLDEISNGKENWIVFLKEFWKPFYDDINVALTIPSSEVIGSLMIQLKDHIFGYDKNGKLQDTCPECGKGKLTLKLGKYGAFVGCSNYPECKYIRNIATLSITEDEPTENEEKFETKLLGKDGNENVYLKKGPYGFYIQKGEDSADKTKKPKRIGIPKSTKEPQNMTFEQAKGLLALPRLIGKHPEDGGEIKANIGPFGPYLMYNKAFYSVKNDDILTIELPRAVVIIEEGKKNKKAKEETKKEEKKEVKKEEKKEIKKESKKGTKKTTKSSKK